MAKSFNPITDAAPPEIPLKNAPLELVIAQVKFPLITSISKPDYIGGFQEKLRKDFPILEPGVSLGITLGPEGLSAGGGGTIWRFHSLDKKWRASLAPDFVALETTDYTSRSDFSNRFRNIIKALATIEPRIIDRIGIRYIDRIHEPKEKACQMIEKEVAGICSTVLFNHIQHTLSESLFDLGDRAKLLSRWGFLPPNVTVDPSVVKSVPHETWVLDVDVSTENIGTFDESMIMDKIEFFAGKAYGFFRWAVTDDFLKHYGGEV